MTILLDPQEGQRRKTAPKAKESPTHVTWRKMRERCICKTSTQWKWYGGRGITVCDRWLNSFEAFLEDMGERPEGTTLDRIDPNGNYEPSNCRWASRDVQARNARHVQRVVYEGEEVLLRELCERLGAPWSRTYQRLRAGYPIDVALKAPENSKRKTFTGEPRGTAKLTVEQVNHIRFSGKTVKALAAELGVSHGCVAKVKQHQTYTNVPPPDVKAAAVKTHAHPVRQWVLVEAA
jgi:hypothetical protein